MTLMEVTLDNLVEFLRETQNVTPAKDDKLQRLAKPLKSDECIEKPQGHCVYGV